MKLYEAFGDRGFHTTIMTTFGVDFDAYENIVLPRLRGAGSYNNILIADQRMLSHALSGASTMPSMAGKQYAVMGAKAKGVFHPKVFLQVGRDRGRLIIGSANATASGLAGNLEIVGMLECTHEDSREQRIIRNSWRYLAPILNVEARTTSQQMKWMLSRAAWLDEAERDPESFSSNESQISLLTTDSDRGILQQFVDHIQDTGIISLTVMSPYWDQDLSAIRLLQRLLQPSETNLLIVPATALFPSHAAEKMSNTRIYDISPMTEGRFAHAKLFIASTESEDHVLYGSANCTSAALGSEKFAGSNEEVCLSRRMVRGRIFEELGLDKLLDQSNQIAPGDLPPFTVEDDIPLDELEGRIPGSFSCQFDSLTWNPSQVCRGRDCEIELLATEGELLTCNLNEKASSSEAERQYYVSDAGARPAFARVRFSDGTVSAQAVVTLLDALRAEVRESRSNSSERAIAQLAGEAEEGLWLLEILDDMEKAQSDDNRAVSLSRRLRETSEVQPTYQVLDYGSFVAGCRLRPQGTAIGRNSLSGTELSFVRAFLNRVLELDEVSQAPEPPGDREEDIRRIIEKVDEPGEVEDVDVGHTLQPIAQVDDEASEDEKKMRRAVKRKQSRDQIVKGVKAFIVRLKERAADESLSSIDILRVRALLTILAAAGWGEINGEADTGRSSLQVLPPTGEDNSWPRLTGMILFALFGGKQPAVEFLRIEEIYDQIPDDLLECWATCIWAVQACLQVADLKTQPRLTSLAARIYREIKLEPAQLIDERFTHFISRLNKRFGSRLALDGADIHESHRRFSTLE